MSERGRTELEEQAERLASAGDQAGALSLLETSLAEPEPSPRSLWLAAELFEQAGEPERARRCYERLLAVDYDYPGALERAVRLGPPEPPPDVEGATVLGSEMLATSRYRVLRELGRGASGTVFLARDLHLERRVALKVYHRRGPSSRKRLQAEARVPARLAHPGIIRVLDLDPGLGAIAMEVLVGGSVAAALRTGPAEPARVGRWMATVVDALAYVHSQGWVHRDLKPSNLLLREDDRAVVTDFGLALRVGERAEGGRGEGTFGFMAPEQQAGAPASFAADVHALGATLAAVLEAGAEPMPASWLELAASCRRSDPSRRPSLSEVAAVFGRGPVAEEPSPG